MKIDLDGQAAIVTGAGGGIGRAVSLALADAGAAVLAVDLDERAGQETAALVAARGRVSTFVRADVSRAQDVAHYVRVATEQWGRIDILMNNAGWQGPVGPIVDCEDDAFDAVMAVNVRGVFLGLKHVLPVMIRQRRGAVVNTASIGAFMGSRHLAPYIASKHAVMGLTRTAALEVIRDGVRVNAVCPGPVDTPLLREIEAGQGKGDGASVRQRRIAAIPRGRFAEPEEIASVMLFLASDLASHMVGQGLHVNGGSYT